ncbi:MAG TPA: tripartite tricarboxylate transporter substrate-binding protein [Alphaproteobacteria bacterium]|nr:tripartite tricarboxylate transporter substrate-binding protein [Alphaproteobacteria bacterium]
MSKGRAAARGFGRLTRNALASLLAATLLAAAGPASAADEVESFYKGKQIYLIMSAGAAGGFNEYARSFAQHMPKHLPGSPTVVVQSMTGAGGLVAMNHLTNNAAQDGTAIGFMHSAMVSADVLMPDKAKFDTRKVHWLGSMDSDSGFCMTWHSTPVKTYQDLKTAPRVILGSAGAGSTQFIHASILKDLWAPNVQLVSGYKDGAEVYLAMERGEVEGRCGVPISSLASVRPDWLPQKKVNILVLFGLNRDKRYAEVPTILELVQDAKAKQALELILAARTVARPVLAPPGVPVVRVAALRKAFMATMQDPAFLAEAEKRNLTLDPVDGERMQAMLAKLHDYPRDIVEMAAKLSD